MSQREHQLVKAGREYLEVRCCCDARLLGWLPAFGLPKTAFYLLRPADWDWNKGPYKDHVLFDVARMRDVAGEEWFAYKNPDLPIETLRRIPTFIEHKA